MQPILSEREIWQRYDDDERRLTAPLTERMLNLAKIAPGMRILDIATGRGEPAIPAAHRVGRDGLVVGVDRSKDSLQMAIDRSAREGLSNMDLRLMDAEVLNGIPTSYFHATLCRWGLMYFDSPISALTAAHRAMLPGALLVAAVWAEPDRVPYFNLPRQILARYAAIPPIDFTAPGTFRYSDVNIIRNDLRAAGFKIDHMEELDVTVMEASNARQVVEWTRAFGLTKLLNNESEDIQRQWEADLCKEAEKLRANEFIRLGGVTRIVVASAL
ncbi:MAG: methyltransferase domain-containing protein [Bdellovibrionota bacterium]|nr:MAG: methyltransferase domain-containing protein [Bdellovibrionota bacterium]